MTDDVNTLEPDDSQARAVDLMCSARFALVTGGPGTGKTTTMRVALARLGARVHVALAAPTGKAAKRMAEATGQDARTVHRLLEYKPGRGFMRGPDCPLDADLVIVDEASMLDVELAAALFSAVGRKTRLVLVGDANQLPSVGPGRVFADLLRSSDIPSATLTHIHRSAAEAWVNRNAPRVLDGAPLELEPTHDFRFVEVAAAGEVLDAVCAACRDDVRAQVLIPKRPGPCGIERANVVLQNVFNGDRGHPVPRDRCLQRADYAMRAGDRVIQTKNDYELAVFNGDVGEIVDIASGKVRVAFTERDTTREVTYTLEQTRALELAYALSVHKSQGSEFEHVVFVAHSSHAFVLTRALLYTAITRTRKRVTLIGDRAGIDAALHSARKADRNTSLLERLDGSLDEVTT